MRKAVSFSRNASGATAAEFALVVPLLLIFIFGIIDVGRLMWTWNRAEKATQMGARYAVVTDVIPEDLDVDFAIDHGQVGGEPVSTSAFSSTLCDNTDCSDDWGYDSDAFNGLVDRMQYFLAEIEADKVTVTYENVGLGFAGDPNAPDVAALVTVRLRNIQFTPITTLLFGAPSFTLPDFSAALTLEDGQGTESN